MPSAIIPSHSSYSVLDNIKLLGVSGEFTKGRYTPKEILC